MSLTGTLTTRAEAVERATAIDGWLTPNEAGLLFDLARQATGPVCEIGSWRGRSTAALGLGVNGQTVYAVDPHTGVPPELSRPSALGGMHGADSSSPAILRANLDAAGLNGQVRIVHKRSEDAAGDVPDGLAVLFVDGDHSYPAASRDLSLYLPKLAPGGVAVLHDATSGDPGVLRAIEEYIDAAPETYRKVRRVDSAIVVRKAPTVRHRIATAFPGGSFTWGAVRGMIHASEAHEITALNNGNGFDDFNAVYAKAMNAYESGLCTHFAMLHSDVEPDKTWLDTLVDQMETTGADLVSVAIPIKDGRGLTSCGIGDPGNQWGPFRRFTVREVLDLPTTFGIEDTPHPDKFLIHNTGCFVVDLRRDLFRATDADGNLRAWFDFPTKIQRVKDRWVPVRESEDWFFSRRIWELGARTAITRAVRLSHRGSHEFPNDRPWGSYATGDEDTRAQWEPKHAD